MENGGGKGGRWGGGGGERGRRNRERRLSNWGEGIGERKVEEEREDRMLEVEEWGREGEKKVCWREDGGGG